MKIFRKRWILVLFSVIFIAAIALTGCGQSAQPEEDKDAEGTNEPENKELILATTTSTQDSGLLDELIPIFEEKTGYMVKIVAVGTGKALAMGEEGNADALLVHAPASEKELEEKGAVVNRQLVMHNDFIIVGPKDDPAGIKDAESAVDALKIISEKKALFVSRGDDSGTHKKELGVWKNAGIEEPEGDWYLSAGQGMGATLDIASEKAGYCITDRATYLAKLDDLELEILYEGDPDLLNIYHVMQTSPEYVEETNADAAKMINVEGGKTFVEFMIDPETQKVIEDFGKDKFGQPLFFPDAGKDEDSIGK